MNQVPAGITLRTQSWGIAEKGPDLVPLVDISSICHARQTCSH